jgi:CHASE2 domain-containing sensor protein
MPRFVPLFMLLVLLFGLVLMRESRESPGLDLEESFVNWLAANTERHVPNAPLALVEINDSSLTADYPWPWTPLEYATFLDTVLQFQPGVIAIEPVLEWDEKKLPPDAQLRHPQYEKILHDRILLAPKILLGAMLGFPEDPDIVPPVQAVPVLRQITGSTK